MFFFNYQKLIIVERSLKLLIAKDITKSRIWKSRLKNVMLPTAHVMQQPMHNLR